MRFKLQLKFRLGSLRLEQQEQAQQQITQQQAQIQQQQGQLRKEQQEQVAKAAKIAANKAAIAAVNKRFGELGDYNIWDEVTVYFGNDKVHVEPEYQTKLLALAQKAKTVTGYVIQVKGYASKGGISRPEPEAKPGTRRECLGSFSSNRVAYRSPTFWPQARWAPADRWLRMRQRRARRKTGAS